MLYPRKGHANLGNPSAVGRMISCGCIFNTIRKGGSGDRLLFQVIFLQTPRRRVVVTLKSVCGPGDHAEPVLTIMLPGED